VRLLDQFIQLFSEPVLGRDDVSEDDLLTFARTHIGSVYTLELLLLIRRNPGKAWTAEDLVRELRSSRTAVGEGLNRLIQAGLVSENPPGSYIFAPMSSQHERFCAEIEKAFASMPASMMKAIVAAPDEKLRLFSNAFKLKE
jgi:predicted transcriptional regulator